jgi:murein DD-endopeptidase MepM/ murein hydrolase activator NlpD
MQSGRVQLLPLSSWWQTSSPDNITVQKGDTLYSLSRRYNTPIRDIIEVNHLTPPYTLYVGRVLRLPIARYHTVAHGDTLYSISRHYNVDITTLSKLNHLREPYALSIGQKLALPASIGGTISTTSVSPASVSSSPTVKSIYSASTSSQPKTQTKSVTKLTTSSTQKVISSTRKTKFMWPIRGTIISRFGTIGKGRSNDGINIKAPLGTLIKAADAGKVVYVGNELKGFGNLILIQHNDGWITAYAHTNSFLVKKGQQVQKGASIAKVGSSGGVNIPQLHFEVRAGKKPVNPMLYLP